MVVGKKMKSGMLVVGNIGSAYLPTYTKKGIFGFYFTISKA